jgi:hypothetical protein
MSFAKAALKSVSKLGSAGAILELEAEAEDME